MIIAQMETNSSLTSKQRERENWPKGWVTVDAAATEAPLVPKWRNAYEGETRHVAFSVPTIITIIIQTTNQKPTSYEKKWNWTEKVTRCFLRKTMETATCVQTAVDQV